MLHYGAQARYPGLMEIIADERTLVDGDTLLGNSAERLIAMFRRGYGLSAHLYPTKDDGAVAACEPDLRAVSHGQSAQELADLTLEEAIITTWGGGHLASLNDLLAAAKMYGGRARPDAPLSDMIIFNIEYIKETDQWAAILEKVLGMYPKKTILCAPERVAQYLRDKSAIVNLSCPFSLIQASSTEEIKKLRSTYNWVWVADGEAGPDAIARLRESGFRIILASGSVRDDIALEGMISAAPDLLCTTIPQKAKEIIARKNSSRPRQTIFKKTLKPFHPNSIKHSLARIRYNTFRRFLGMIEKRTGMFISFHTRPIYSSGITLVADTLVDTPSCAIVLQGPLLKKYDFTLETVRIYKKVHPGLKIIISTWEDEDADYLKRIKDENIEIVLNKKPDYNGPLNVNMQITSARGGIRRAKELAVEYVIKSRTDQRMYNKNIIESLYNLVRYFPASARSGQKKRLVFGHNCPKYQPYYFSDIFIFGDIDDMLEYWQTDLIERGIEYPIFSAEIFLASSYLKRKGWPLVWTIESAWDIYRECIVTIDWAEIELFWLKYDYFWERDIGRHRNHYVQAYMPVPDFLHFHEWFNLFSNRENKTYSLKQEGSIRLLSPKKPLP